MKLIPDDGKRSAKLVLIGEMPAAHEEALGRPFVGPAGQTLLRWWRETGFQRSDFYITNVVPYRHNNKNLITLVPRDEIQHWTQELHTRLAQLDDPTVIVPTGNTALRALTGKSGITKHRGSIYGYQDARRRTIKVIPTIHPAAIFKQPGWERRCLADWRRILADVAYRELRLPEREHYIRPSLDDCFAYLEDARQRAEALAIDLETPRELRFEQFTTKRGKVKERKVKGDPRVTCVGFSFDPLYSITIPTTASYWGDPESLATAWDIIKQLCELEVEKVLQNGGFDAFWLALRGISLNLWRWDTRWLSHARDPLDSHSLDYQASIHTREPYWKDDTKEKLEDQEFSDIETFWRYCGKDACVTRELLDTHHARLGPNVKWYLTHYQRLFAPMLEMSLAGMRMNDAARRRKSAQYVAECIGIQDKLLALAGEPLYGEKGSLSFKKLSHYLYQTLHLPEQKNRATGGVTTREVAVRTLMLRFPAKLGRDGEDEMPGPLILRHRRLEALRRFTKEGILDDDGRSRSSFGWVDTMRLRSGKNPRRTGNNSQNTDRELLDLYVPDPGCIYLECDLSQAEDRVVKMLTGSARLIERARAKPWENDEHKRAAALIFPGYKSWQDVPSKGPGKENHRYIGKRGRHAGNYDMHGKRLAEELLKEGIVYTPDEGSRIIRTIIDQDTPEVRDWQRGVRQFVLRHRSIGNSWGLVWDLSHERLNDDLFRRCYAMVPQSEVVTLMNQWGWWPLYQYIKESQIPATVNNQKHDSVLISTPPTHAWELACFLKASLERPRRYAGNELTIPVEFKLGRTAAGEHEFKRFPTKRELEEVAHALAEKVS